ncbi:CO dehydrogenase/acetyl-CoA synthase complex subunit epsilon [Candidatus Bathyarchaeota archaeon]|nr:CO dehydrogenase/acetyl-CoA synthase complex subunit epsilon [Candidatus Bathyarchaeota archaeon]NIU80913.1 CO dehydrogenase/acetyl-CoA synthase complex subunit epsilon [Candidatus Bathyarchaeota archaeon]NIV67572.1 CO dehydrogenase/acetyl-CoA synthase complex subunit epsilon [Candidatus Bathyarchaeota archaeon]NIW16190.1 CO dehydrogenase/acetyl-CoA synthase complex subunit epsilon [Candidatus Bathyarchaeota archaeon]
MTMKAEPWQTAEIAGPKKALLIRKPEVVVAMVKRVKRPLMVVGHLAAEDYSEDIKMIDYAIRMSEAAAIPVVATAHMTAEFTKRGFQPSGWMSAMDIGNRLKDPEWRGLDGTGPYDLAMFMGLPYYMEFVILAGLKHFSPHLETISLDRYYNPHARWSFPNLPVKEWNESFQIIVNKLGGE